MKSVELLFYPDTVKAGEKAGLECSEYPVFGGFPPSLALHLLG
jgi:hypothetical protein